MTDAFLSMTLVLVFQMSERFGDVPVLMHVKCFKARTERRHSSFDAEFVTRGTWSAAGNGTRGTEAEAQRDRVGTLAAFPLSARYL
jgi:hypothetical protein